MAQTLDVKKLILIPAVITLILSIIRLVGELAGGPAILFGRAAGGGGALVGIVWLVPILGIYFSMKIHCAGYAPRSAWRLIGLALLGIVLTIVIFVGVMSVLGQTSMLTMVLCSFATLGVGFIVRSAWPELFRVLFAYGFAARIPVIVIMFFAILLDLGTHYDAPPPEMQQVGNWFFEWVLTGVIPQATIWIGFTVLVGSLFAGVTALFLKQPAE